MACGWGFGFGVDIKGGSAGDEELVGGELGYEEGAGGGVVVGHFGKVGLELEGVG